jgi:hypothetical protein
LLAIVWILFLPEFRHLYGNSCADRMACRPHYSYTRESTRIKKKIKSSKMSVKEHKDPCNNKSRHINVESNHLSTWHLRNFLPDICVGATH